MHPFLALQPFVASPAERITSPAPFPVLLPPIQLDSPLHVASTVPKRPLSPKRHTLVDHRVSPVQAHRRRRHSRPDYTIECLGATAFFDQLPWISALESPDLSSVRDIADLSQLDIRPLSNSTCGPGPVRHRKSSLRSSLRNAQTENVFDGLPSWIIYPPSRFVRTPSSPRTPRNLRAPLTPSRVQFHNLLPVFSPPARSDRESDGSKFVVSD